MLPARLIRALGRTGHTSCEHQFMERRIPLYLCNNCKNQPHENFYGSGAFYDIYTTDRQAVWADHLTSGDTCIVLSEPTKGQLTFDWFRFSHEQRGRFDGKATRVFFGKRFKSQTLSRTDAMRDGIYSNFFKVTGGLKQQTLLRVV
jgi:hypothetical protein